MKVKYVNNPVPTLLPHIAAARARRRDRAAKRLALPKLKQGEASLPQTARRLRLHSVRSV